MSDVKRYECLLIEDAPRLQAILPQGAVVCSERTQTMVTAEDYAKLEAEAQALRDEVAALRARVVVPDGYALVPIELTRDMWVAVNKEDDRAYAGACDHGAQFDWLWEAAIEAAPRLNGKTVSEGLLRRIIQHLEWNGTEDQDITVMDYIRRGDSMAEELRTLLGKGKEHE